MRWAVIPLFNSKKPAILYEVKGKCMSPIHGNRKHKTVFTSESKMVTNWCESCRRRAYGDSFRIFKTKEEAEAECVIDCL